MVIIIRVCRFVDKLCFKKGWYRQGIAFSSGFFTTLALPPIHLFPICFFTFSIFVRLLDGIVAQYNRDQNCCSYAYLAALTGWSFGLGYFTGGLWWLGSVLLLDIDAYGWLIPFAIFVFPAFLSIFYAFASFCAALINQSGYGRVIVLSLTFGLAEWFRSFLFTGFPWNSIGYLAMPFPLLMQPIALVGIYGMNIFAVLIYAAPTLFFEKKGKRVGLTVTGLLIVVDICFGLYRFYSFDISLQEGKEKNIRVRIVQPSIPLGEKIDTKTLYKYLERQLSLSSALAKDNYSAPQIIIWPETAIPAILDENPEFLYLIGKSLNDKQFALIGTIRSEKAISTDGIKIVHYFNSIHVIDSLGKRIAFSDKVHLVPFGEYIPFISILPNLGTKLTGIAGNYTSADRHKSIVLDNGIVIFPLICYEVIFSSEMDYDGPKADFIVNITNDSWFKNTTEPWQHFAQARIQAVEQGLPLVRVANNGISAVIDPLGRIISILPYDKVGFVDAEISLQERSLLNRYSKYLPFSCILAIFFLNFKQLRKIYR